ncbi:hypothetical protein [Lacinutrix chionoecetis]
MIVNTTYQNNENKKLIDNLVGKGFRLRERFRLKGIGSKRMIIENVSPNLEQYLNLVSDLNYANIELRPKGILIHINKGLQNFSWAIPYYQLVIYKTNGSSIHAQGRFIHFKNNKLFKENKSFFKKLLCEKIKYDEQYNFQTQ